MDSLTSTGESIDDDWEYVEVMSRTKRWQVNHHQSYPASAVNDRQSPTVGPGKDFQKKITDYCAQMAVTQKRKEIVWGV